MKRVQNSQEGISMFIGVVKLDKELYGHHISIGSLYEHGGFAVYYVRLPSLIEPPHECIMLLLNQLWHEVNYVLPGSLLLGPPDECSEAGIGLDNFSEILPVGIDYDEVRVVANLLRGLLIVEVLLVDFVNFEYAFHFPNVYFICCRVIQQVQLRYGKLKVHIVVFRHLALIQLLKHLKDLLYPLSNT
jgi:hypothetical protein